MKAFGLGWIKVWLVCCAFMTLTGCETTKKRDAAADGGKVVSCQYCYDKAVYYMNQHGHTLKLTKHACPDCKTEIELYSQAGKIMMKCARCAPEGIPCDKCLPPKATAPGA